MWGFSLIKSEIKSNFGSISLIWKFRIGFTLLITLPIIIQIIHIITVFTDFSVFLPLIVPFLILLLRYRFYIYNLLECIKTKLLNFIKYLKLNKLIFYKLIKKIYKEYQLYSEIIFYLSIWLFTSYWLLKGKNINISHPITVILSGSLALFILLWLKDRYSKILEDLKECVKKEENLFSEHKKIIYLKNSYKSNSAILVIFVLLIIVGLKDVLTSHTSIFLIAIFGLVIIMYGLLITSEFFRFLLELIKVEFEYPNYESFYFRFKKLGDVSFYAALGWIFGVILNIQFLTQEGLLGHIFSIAFFAGLILSVLSIFLPQYLLHRILLKEKQKLIKKYKKRNNLIRKILYSKPKDIDEEIRNLPEWAISNKRVIFYIISLALTIITIINKFMASIINLN